MRTCAPLQSAKRTLIAGLCAVTALGPATAQDWRDFPEVYLNEARLTVFDFGLYCTEGDGVEAEAPDTINGSVVSVDGSRLMAVQQQIPAALGVTFGVRAGALANLNTDARFTISHPPMGANNVTEQGWFVGFDDAGPSGAYWVFEDDFELVTGSWFMSARDLQGELLFSVAFEVVPPDAYTGAIPSCIADLLS